MSRIHSSSEPCRICGGCLLEAFKGKVLGDVDVQYGLCESCRSLILPEPSWLERAYTTVFSPDPDFGDLSRCQYVHRVLRRFRHLGLLPKAYRSLDFGCGKAVLLRLLRDQGLDAWGYDAYPHPCFAEDRVLDHLPEGPFDLITAIEVIEHTTDPVPTLTRLKNLLAPSGLLVISTELFDEKAHGSDWVYLAPEHGQHITLFSQKGLRRAADNTGLTWAFSLPWAGKDFLHVFTQPGHRLPAWGLLRLKLEHNRRERSARRDAKS